MSIDQKGKGLSSRQRVGLVAVPVLVIIVGLGVLGLLSGNPSTSTSHTAVAARPTPTATRAGVKHVCSSYVPSRLPLGVLPRDRSLVPFSDTVLGVDGKWTDDSGARSVEIVDGGYVDDVTEPYDGLHQIGTASVGAKQVEVDEATFQSRPVYMALWRDPQADVPCDVHAVVGLGLTQDEFSAVLASIQPRKAATAK